MAIQIYWKPADMGKTLYLSGTQPGGYSGPVNPSLGNTRPWNSYMTTIEKVVIQSAFSGTYGTLSGWFSGATNLKTIEGWNYILSSNIVWMDSTFKNCSSLVSPPAIPSTVVTLRNCFYGCTSLTGTLQAYNDEFDLDGSTGAMGVTEGVFYNTTKPIYVNVLGSNSISTWRKIINSYPNVYLSNTAFTIGDYSYVIAGNNAFPSVASTTKTSYGDLSSTVTYNNITYSITDISYCYSGCTNLVVAPSLPNSITNMTYAFNGCTSLTSVSLPSSVEDLSYCFYKCSSLTTMPTIPQSVTNMLYCFYDSGIQGDIDLTLNNVTDMSYCFYSCNDITNIDVYAPKVKNMSWCFGSDTNLLTATLECSLCTNFTRCFSNCSYLQNATIESTVSCSIQETFGDCTNLESAVLPIIVSSMSGCFSNCSSLTVAPEFPQTISGLSGLYACFSGCTSLVSVPYPIPASVTSMGSCFKNCINLSGVITVNNKVTINTAFTYYVDMFLGTVNNIIIINNSELSGAQENWEIVAADYNNVSIVQNAAVYGDYVYIETSASEAKVVTIDKTKVTYDEIEENINIKGTSHTITSLEHCYEDCTNFNQNLNEIIPFNSYIKNMSYCFANCTSFNSSVIIPPGVTDVSYCFANCTSFNADNITLSGFLQRIDDSISITSQETYYNFQTTPRGRSQIKIYDDVIINDQPICTFIASESNSEYTYGEYTFYYNCDSQYEYIKIVTQNQPDTTQSFRIEYTVDRVSLANMERCFSGCTLLNKLIYIPNSVTNLNYCFSNCVNLNQSILIPSSVLSMAFCFYGCTRLNQQIIIRPGVTNVSGCFSGCTIFNQSVIIPNTVTNMSSMFSNCSFFNKYMVIPNSVVNMSGCFNNCTSLNSIIEINGILTDYADLFSYTTKKIILCRSIGNDSSPTKEMLKAYADTSSSGNVVVGELFSNFEIQRDEDDPSMLHVVTSIERFRGGGEPINIRLLLHNVGTQVTWYSSQEDEELERNPLQATVMNFKNQIFYGRIKNITEDDRSIFTVYVEDGFSTTTPYEIIVPNAYYTIDFLRGGRGVSFGQRATNADMYFPLQGATVFEPGKYYSRLNDEFTLLNEKPDEWDEEPSDFYYMENPEGLFKNNMNSLFKKRLDIYEEEDLYDEEDNMPLTEELIKLGWDNDCISYSDSMEMKKASLHLREILKHLLNPLVGEIKAYAGTNVPPGWLDCDGSPVNKDEYPELWKVLGNTWGQSTETQFYLPDLKGRTLIGSQSGTFNVGGTGGSPGIQAHTHGVTTQPNFSVSGGAHAHGINSSGSNAAFVGLAGSGTDVGIGEVRVTDTKSGSNYVPRCSASGTDFQRVVNTKNVTPSSYTVSRTANVVIGGVTTSATVQTGSSNNYQPYKVVRYIIKY